MSIEKFIVGKLYRTSVTSRCQDEHQQTRMFIRFTDMNIKMSSEPDKGYNHPQLNKLLSIIQGNWERDIPYLYTGWMLDRTHEADLELSLCHKFIWDTHFLLIPDRCRRLHYPLPLHKYFEEY